MPGNGCILRITWGGARGLMVKDGASLYGCGQICRLITLCGLTASLSMGCHLLHCGCLSNVAHKWTCTLLAHTDFTCWRSQNDFCGSSQSFFSRFTCLMNFLRFLSFLSFASVDLIKETTDKATGWNSEPIWWVSAKCCEKVLAFLLFFIILSNYKIYFNNVQGYINCIFLIINFIKEKSYQKQKTNIHGYC